ncbi:MULTISPECIES: chromate resistance protein ChrB domain-containing protein [Spirosoma]|uniref:Chromate resistance protein n=1 Tax=Spirosoma liriopis TaxID=2937440 RepID=A0ABT0HUA3_9BACT|nr:MULTISPECIES: chromate resistance protein ChrB domain-containing protein [Spirosoma]MCK8495765.1 chromate resistance protein [Spirosoma liriopis]UHG94814.1 chromate resistance protein [Spirosoma oryzicola]
MIWITRQRPKIDRLACPWLILRFVDKDAQFLFVPTEQVIEKAKNLGGIPFDVPDVEFSHYGQDCTFDYILKKYELTDPALQTMAPIVRGADTDHHELAQQAAGLWAISAGLAHNIQDDYALLTQGIIIYDALYSWATHLQNQKHTQQPEEHLLLRFFTTYLHEIRDRKLNPPPWAAELKELIQDHIDTNLSLSLSTVAQSLQVNPTYLSRAFAQYFDNLTFGDYIRKLRIEKAIQLLETTSHSLSEIAYLTGFSDQSHFTRIFKKMMGQNPSQYRKNNSKRKAGPNG